MATPSRLDNLTAAIMAQAPVDGCAILPAGTTNPAWHLVTNTSTSEVIRIDYNASATAGQITNGDNAAIAFNLVAGVDNPPVSIVYGDNILINATVNFDQRSRSGTVVNDANHSLDRWINLAESASTTVGNQGFSRARITQSTAGSYRAGLTQIVESTYATPYRSNPLVFQGQVRVSAACNIRFAVLEWTGTADGCPRDPVNSWTSTTYTPGNFFVSTLNVLAVGSIAATTADQTFSLTATPSASMNNLYVMVWLESAQAQNVYFEVAQLGLYSGSNLRNWSPRPYSIEESLCRRYCLRLLSYDLGQAQQASRVYQSGVLFPVTMRITPLNLNLAFAVNAGSAGTVTFQNGSAYSMGFYNSAGNWTVGALVTITGVLEAEI